MLPRAHALAAAEGPEPSAPVGSHSGYAWRPHSRRHVEQAPAGRPSRRGGGFRGGVVGVALIVGAVHHHWLRGAEGGRGLGIRQSGVGLAVKATVRGLAACAPCAAGKRNRCGLVPHQRSDSAASSPAAVKMHPTTSSAP